MDEANARSEESQSGRGDPKPSGAMKTVDPKPPFQRLSRKLEGQTGERPKPTHVLRNEAVGTKPPNVRWNCGTKRTAHMCTANVRVIRTCSQGLAEVNGPEPVTCTVDEDSRPRARPLVQKTERQAETEANGPEPTHVLRTKTVGPEPLLVQKLKVRQRRMAQSQRMF